MIGTSLGLGILGLRVGGPAIPPPLPDPVVPVLPMAAAARWHPGFSQVATQSGRVVSASDLQGLAQVAASGAGLGPQALTDGQGRKFWRFAGGQFLDVAAGLVCGSRNMSVFMVARVPRHPASYNRYLSMGSQAQGTQVNTLGGPLETRVVSQSAGHVQAFGKLAYTASAGAEWLVPGAQKQVIGMTSGAGGQRLFLNERHVDVAAAYAATGIAGAEIGRYSWSPGAAVTWGVFDLYEMIVYTTALSNADAQAVTEALMGTHGIVPVTSQLVLEGDSITQGTGDVTEALSCAAVLTEPGTTHVPAGWRVINKGMSGNKVSDLMTRRDAANGWATQRLPGQNVVAFEIGRNDWAANITAPQHYANVVSYLNKATTGVLQLGWTVHLQDVSMSLRRILSATPAHTGSSTRRRPAIPLTTRVTARIPTCWARASASPAATRRNTGSRRGCSAGLAVSLTIKTSFKDLALHGAGDMSLDSEDLILEPV
ncbi:hypothetical protein [Loktanella sp. M215]|uniref:hypothetical protein n=1 Tax=Loktanella sp. M215 TaxID=2675431 RepID=UPI001F31A2B4|nr:hypothetical protein [Loktanella sp. M215]MCF7702205.1 hypothetical protein [Loktanella sp. M215]